MPPARGTVVWVRGLRRLVPLAVACALALPAAPAGASVASRPVLASEPGVTSGLVAELEEVVKASQAAYGDALVVEVLGRVGLPEGVAQVGTSVEGEGSVWLLDAQGGLVVAAGDAFGGDLYTTPMGTLPVASADVRGFTRAARAAGISLSTLLRVEPADYGFWNFSKKSLSPAAVASLQGSVSPVRYVQAVLEEHAKSSSASLAKEVVADLVTYRWVDGRGTVVLIFVRAGVLLGVDVTSGPERKSVMVVESGVMVTPPSLPEEIVEAAIVMKHFAGPLSASTRLQLREWLKSTTGLFRAAMDDRGYVSKAYARKVLQRVLRGGGVRVKATPSGVRVSDRSPWGPIAFDMVLARNKGTWLVMVRAAR